jgi:hypothetical protein
MSSFDSSTPIVNQPTLYIRDMKVSNNATTPNTQLDVSAGICRDSTNTFDINLGNYNGQNNSGTANAVTTINAATTGLNALDTGVLVLSTVYKVFVVADAVSGNKTGLMLSTASAATGPLLPFGYNIFRHIGYAVTDASVHFLLFWQTGNQNARRFTFDAPQATAVTAGTSATYAAIALTKWVPAADNLPILFSVNWTANGAADTFNMQGGNSTGDQFLAIAPVAGGTAHTVVWPTVLSQLVAGVPTSNYKVSAVGGVAINVAAFDFYI